MFLQNDGKFIPDYTVSHPIIIIIVVVYLFIYLFVHLLSSFVSLYFLLEKKCKELWYYARHFHDLEF
jgi:uncharacterized membrane protein